MTTRKKNAFTLIELLIVVAIMSILAASLIAYIILPPREQAQATTDLEIEQGLGGFFAKLVGDAHNAAVLKPAREGKALIFDNAPDRLHAVYFIDGKNFLRRAVMADTEWVESADAPTSITPALLARGVRKLTAKQLEEPGLWRIGVTLATGDELQPTVDRTIEVSVGHFRRK